MRTIFLVVGVLAVATAFAPVAVAGHHDDPLLVCTASMPPECEVGDVPTATCTMSMPPECKTQ